MSRTELQIDNEALNKWVSQLPSTARPDVRLAADARISVQVAKRILEDGYVPTEKIRWCVSMATGIAEAVLWKLKPAKQKRA